MKNITASVYELTVTGDDYEIGNTQTYGLPVTAPVTLVKELLAYALMVEKGYRTHAALAADGYEFAPEGPAWYDGEGDPEAAAWAWDWNREVPTPPAYTPAR